MRILIWKEQLCKIRSWGVFNLSDYGCLVNWNVIVTSAVQMSDDEAWSIGRRQWRLWQRWKRKSHGGGGTDDWPWGILRTIIFSALSLFISGHADLLAKIYQFSLLDSVRFSYCTFSADSNICFAFYLREMLKLLVVNHGKNALQNQGRLSRVEKRHRQRRNQRERHLRRK